MKKLIFLLIATVFSISIKAQIGFISYGHASQDSIFFIDHMAAGAISGLNPNNGDDWMALATDISADIVYAFSNCGDFTGPAFYSLDYSSFANSPTQITTHTNNKSVI